MDMHFTSIDVFVRNHKKANTVKRKMEYNDEVNCHTRLRNKNGRREKNLCVYVVRQMKDRNLRNNFVLN